MNKLVSTDFDMISYLMRLPTRELHHFGRDQVIFATGDPADMIYFVLVGMIAISVVTEAAREAVISITKPGQFFGQVCVLAKEVRMTTAVPITEIATVVGINRATTTQLLTRDPTFSKAFIADLLTRVDAIESDLVDRIFHNRDQLLARSLLQLADDSDTVGPISQTLLAKKIGSTRSYVGQALRKFRERNLVEYAMHGPRAPKRIKLNTPGLLDFVSHDLKLG